MPLVHGFVVRMLISRCRPSDCRWTDVWKWLPRGRRGVWLRWDKSKWMPPFLCSLFIFAHFRKRFFSVRPIGACAHFVMVSENSTDAILACHPSLFTEWLGWVAISCEPQRICTGHIEALKCSPDCIQFIKGCGLEHGHHVMLHRVEICFKIACTLLKLYRCTVILFSGLCWSFLQSKVAPMRWCRPTSCRHRLHLFVCFLFVSF